MKKISLLLVLILIASMGCRQKTPTEASKYDFSPKEPEYLNVAPSTVSFALEFDGTNYILKRTSLTNVRPSTFDLEMDGPEVIAGRLKLFEFELIDSLGQVYFRELVTAPATLRSNFPDDQNKTVLHQEGPLSKIVISPSFPLTVIKEIEPAGIQIREVKIRDKQIIPGNLKDTTRSLIRLDSIPQKLRYNEK